MYPLGHGRPPERTLSGNRTGYLPRQARRPSTADATMRVLSQQIHRRWCKAPKACMPHCHSHRMQPAMPQARRASSGAFRQRRHAALRAARNRDGSRLEPRRSRMQQAMPRARRALSGAGSAAAPRHSPSSAAAAAAGPVSGGAVCSRPCLKHASSLERQVAAPGSQPGLAPRRHAAASACSAAPALAAASALRMHSLSPAAASSCAAFLSCPLRAGGLVSHPISEVCVPSRALAVHAQRAAPAHPAQLDGDASIASPRVAPPAAPRSERPAAPRTQRHRPASAANSGPGSHASVASGPSGPTLRYCGRCTRRRQNASDPPSPTAMACSRHAFLARLASRA